MDQFQTLQGTRTTINNITSYDYMVRTPGLNIFDNSLESVKISMDIRKDCQLQNRLLEAFIA
jgi:hypothetical protein